MIPVSLISDSPEPTSELHSQDSLQFLLHLVDPVHKLSHTTVTQIIPRHWLDIWDQYEWVEDTVAEVIRIGVEVLGQEYVVARMGWGSQSGESKEEQKGGEQEQEEQEEQDSDEEDDESEGSQNGKDS